MRVVVVGGGVIGVCSAYYLSRRGLDVVLLERRELGSGASSGNAGVIAPGHPPLNKPERRERPLRLLLDPLSPLYIAPRWDPALFRWLWSFRKACTQTHLQEAMKALAPLGHSTRALFDELVREESLDCGYRTSGYYEVCRTRDGLASAKKDAALMREYGYEVEAVEGDELRRREPALAEGTLGGVFYADAAICRPEQFVHGVAERVVERGGVVRTGSEVVAIRSVGGAVTGVRTEDGEIGADAVVVATGAYSTGLIRRFGWRLPLQAAKGYHRDLPVRSGAAPHLRTACVLAETLVFCTPMNGTLRFAGTLELSGIDHRIRPRRLLQLTRAARDYFTELDDARPISEWCGLRPCTPDGLPIVGPVPDVDGLFVATGHAMMGLTLGPITGRLISELVAGEAPSIDTGSLGVERFRS